MFNIAYGRPHLDAASDIKRVINSFNGQPFAWWVHPSGVDTSFEEDLLYTGFIKETTEHAMICDLTSIQSYMPKTDLQIQIVQNREGLEDFIKILEPYDPSARAFYEMIPDKLLSQNETLCVGYAEHRPMVIGIVCRYREASGIFSLLTSEDGRCKGYGSDMMGYLMTKAKSDGSMYATLSASSDSGFRIYERLGFKKAGEFDCYEWKSDDSSVR
jgi:hypothetical protein